MSILQLYSNNTPNRKEMNPLNIKVRAEKEEHI